MFLELPRASLLHEMHDPLSTGEPWKQKSLPMRSAGAATASRDAFWEVPGAGGSVRRSSSARVEFVGLQEQLLACPEQDMAPLGK